MTDLANPPAAIAVRSSRRATSAEHDDFVCIVDAELRVHQPSSALRDLAARLGTPLTDGASLDAPSWPAAVRERWLPLVRRGLAGERVVAEVEVAFPGGVMVAELRIQPQRAATGAVAAVLCVARDITHVQAMVARHAADAARHDLLLRATLDGVWDWNLATGEVWVSPRAHALLGMPEDSTGGRAFETWRDALHEEDRPRVLAAIERHLAGVAPYREVYRIRRHDGVWRWFESHGIVARDADGRAVRMVGADRDVTARVEAEQELLLVHARMEQAFRMARVGAWTFTPATGELWWSDGTYRLFDRDPSLGPPDYPTYLSYIHPDDRDALATAVEVTLASGSDYAIEHRHVRPDGTVYTFQAMGRVTRAADGSVLALAGTVLDISAYKRIEAALREAKEVAEASSLAKSDFLASMSHELRTPLNAVIGFAQRLERLPAGTPLGERERLFVERITSNGRHLLSVIDDILDIARIEAGHMDVELAPTDVGTLCAEVVTQLEAAPRAPGVALVLEVPDDLAPVRSDSRRLQQVLVNLVGNALKFTTQGGVRVRVRADATTHRPIAVDVIDTGIGIPAPRLPYIFDKFEQAERGTQRRFGGSGLGLAICRALCGMMGHTLTVESTEGVGSTFSVILAPADAA